MDVLSEEQTLQAVLGRDVGLDNQGMDDFDLEEYITRDDMCLPEEAISAVAYGTGRPPDSLGQDDLKLNVRLQNPPPPHTQSVPLSAHDMYCSVAQPRMTYDPLPQYKHTPLPDSPPDSGSEPYSPADGNHHNIQDHLSHGNPLNFQDHMNFSPPHANPHNYSDQLRFSPPHGNQQAYQDKSRNLVTSATTIPGSMYPHQVSSICVSSKGQPQNGYMVEPPKLNHLPVTRAPPGNLPSQHPINQISPPMTHPILPPHFGSISNINSLANHQTKKRKISDSPNNTINGNMLNGLNGMNNILGIKQEPPGVNFQPYGMPDLGDDDYSYDLDGSGFMDSSYQVIKWQSYNPTKWCPLADTDLKDLPSIRYRVDADKGFNFSVPDDSFVCQKKNHFQVTVHMSIDGVPKYIRSPDGVKKVDTFFLHFHGIKMESPTQTVKIEQSQSDRSKKAFHPVKIDLSPDQVNKITVGRLHFSETTSNNMRKKGKPNPDQRYFLLVVMLQAHCGDNTYMVAGSSSEKIIVRASNPGQFDSDVDIPWAKGHTQDSVFHIGRVGINTDHPEEALTIHGNIKLTGHLMQPSDIRAKENIEELNTKESLQKVSQLRLYKYNYCDDYADTAGIPKDSRTDTGVIAQEMMEVLPDAVQETGDVILRSGQCIENFLVVKKDRIFMENVGAVKELCKLTDNLENRIDELEKMNKRLTKLKRFDSLKSNVSSKSGTSVSTVSSSVSPPKKASGHGHSQSKLHHKSSRRSSGRFPQIPILCSNKFIQATIIILILIMAFCLVAITTLYILERHKAPQPHILIQNTPPTLPANSRQTILNDTTPGTNSTSGRGSTPKPPVTLPGQEKSSTALPTLTSALTTKGVRIASPKVPAFPRCSGRCEVQCCQVPSEDQPDIHTYPGQRNAIDSNLVSSATTKRPQLNTVVVDIPTQEGSDPQVINNGYNIIDGSYNIINSNDNSGYNSYNVVHYRTKRQVTLETSIMVKEVNFTFGPAYCLEDCLSHNKSYFAKLSPYFGYSDPVTLQFSLPVRARVTFCGFHPFSRQCLPETIENPTPSPPSQWTNLAEFRVNIGLYYKTSYKFRITTSRTIRNLCNQVQTSDNFYEYNLYFQRTCEE
ncbi:myelin regulatory factor-like isoform X2 [Gigantopelta aegis]|uniref:myelin regulatory factor-like isoform X2 n=1 Tax=Gigantopelta aegis TaxID=1735272 RepID=UPI001B88D9A9|nr:myelin regulatory factor-like isoform X2 [Gigantopelta aegis]